jgi:hypothetical protein
MRLAFFVFPDDMVELDLISLARITADVSVGVVD